MILFQQHIQKDIWQRSDDLLVHTTQNLEGEAAISGASFTHVLCSALRKLSNFTVVMEAESLEIPFGLTVSVFFGTQGVCNISLQHTE